MLPVEPAAGRLASRRRLVRLLPLAIALVAIGGFGGVVGYYYMTHLRGGEDGVAPLIRAEQRPIKVRPEHPGGLEVPHQDKEIYSRVGQLAPAAPTPLPPGVERLLPPPEAPLPRPLAPPEIPAVAAPPPAIAVPEAPAAGAPPSPPAVAAPPPAVAVAGGAGFRVQLGSVKSPEHATREWEKLRRAYPDVLENLTLTVVQADLGERGTFYRIQAGPLGDHATASAICAALAPHRVGCLIVRPGSDR
ncbi:MAG: SPOR domain-containing protein [Pseudomonadota bacterium]